MLTLLGSLCTVYLDGSHCPCPASSYLGGTCPMYEYARRKLVIETVHGYGNLTFEDGFGDVLVGGNVSVIYESIRDGKMQDVVIRLFQ
jgi:phenylalanine ammonia-lyase